MLSRLLLAIVLLAPSGLLAQGILGDWQGTLRGGPRDMRVVLEISASDSGGLSAFLYRIDQSTEPIPADSVTSEGDRFRVSIQPMGANFEGRLAPDHSKITGTWTQNQSQQLELQRSTEGTAWPKDPTAHTVVFTTAEPGIRLEVLDYGGSGRPIILLTGLGNNAHVFDKLAPKLTPSAHVFAISRRGFGRSTAPPPTAANYGADRLGDDVLAVIEDLKLDRPVLIGHSIAGEELSSVGSRHPEKVSGLVYLDAAMGYAAYDPSRGFLAIDRLELAKKLEQLDPSNPPDDKQDLMREILSVDLPAIERSLQGELNIAELLPRPPAQPDSAPSTPTIFDRIFSAILDGPRKYTHIAVPSLAIYASPHDMPNLRGDPTARAKWEAFDIERMKAQASAFSAASPSARVVTLARANHYVFLSNETDVLREINSFLGDLK